MGKKKQPLHFDNIFLLIKRKFNQVLPKCEYWTILCNWLAPWATGGANLEKNLLDSSNSLSSAAELSSLLFDELLLLALALLRTSESSTGIRTPLAVGVPVVTPPPVEAARPKGRSPKVAARFAKLFFVFYMHFVHKGCYFFVYIYHLTIQQFRETEFFCFAKWHTRVSKLFWVVLWKPVVTEYLWKKNQQFFSAER